LQTGGPRAIKLQLSVSDRVVRCVADRDLLERAREEIRARLEELEPLVTEHERLQRALSALEASDQPTPPNGGTVERQRPGTSRRAKRGERRRQLLELLETEPGLRPSQAAERMSIDPNQLRSLAKRLEEEGSVQRREGRLYPSRRS
jgi:transcriptional regulator with GAF, ATPase, and Fis domain